MSKLVRFDWAMKYLLRNKANFDVLEGFLSELLKTDIKIECVLESEGNQQRFDDKYNRVDVLAHTTTGERIIIEVQVANQWDYLSRVLYGTSKVVTEYIKAGEAYKDIRKVISVSIVFFDLGAGNDYLYQGQTEFRGLHTQDLLALGPNEQKAYGPDIKVPSDIFPEYYIIKVNQFNERIKDKLDEWIYFLKTEKIEASFNAKGIQSAAEKLEVLRLAPEERRAYEDYQTSLHHEASMVFSSYGMGKLDGEAEGLEKGEAIGLEKGEAIGLEKGEAIGLEKGEVIGIAKGERTLLLRQIKRKSFILSETQASMIEQADTEQLLEWAERVLDAHTIEDIFKN